MFDYPFPPLRAGLYAQLGLGPEATAEEINEASQELASRLRSQQRALQRDLDQVYREVPGLRDAWTELKALEEAGQAADAEKYREVQLKLVRLEETAARVRRDFKRLRTQAQELEQQLHQVNLLKIRSPADRREYDRSNPPFELIKLADCGASPFADRKTMLAMVRRELSDFFEQAGETVFHPTDLTRCDFSHDFETDKNLDRDL